MEIDRKLNILTLNYEYPPVGGGGGYICKNVMDELAEKVKGMIPNEKELLTMF